MAFCCPNCGTLIEQNIFFQVVGQCKCHACGNIVDLLNVSCDSSDSYAYRRQPTSAKGKDVDLELRRKTMDEMGSLLNIIENHPKQATPGTAYLVFLRLENEALQEYSIHVDALRNSIVKLEAKEGVSEYSAAAECKVLSCFERAKTAWAEGIERIEFLFIHKAKLLNKLQEVDEDVLIDGKLVMKKVHNIPMALEVEIDESEAEDFVKDFIFERRNTGWEQATKYIKELDALFYIEGVRGTGRKTLSQQADKTCFIATATYGEEGYEQIEQLRIFRDHLLMKCQLGKRVVKAYYLLSPPVAEMIEKSEPLRYMSKIILHPVLAIVHEVNKKLRRNPRDCDLARMS